MLVCSDECSEIGKNICCLECKICETCDNRCCLSNIFTKKNVLDSCEDCKDTEE